MDFLQILAKISVLLFFFSTSSSAALDVVGVASVETKNQQTRPQRKSKERCVLFLLFPTTHSTRSLRNSSRYPSPPKTSSWHCNDYHLIRMRKSLGLCPFTSCEAMELWFLKDYAAEDTIKLYRVSTESIRKDLLFKTDVRAFRPLALLKEDELLLRWNHEVFTVYDLKLKPISQLFKRSGRCAWSSPSVLKHLHVSRIPFSRDMRM